MGNQLITYIREKRILFMSGEVTNHTVEVLRKYYQEQSGGP